MKSKLININEMLKKAVAGKYAVIHLNINNLLWIKAALAAAQQNNAPIILGVSESAVKWMCGYKNVVDMVNNAIDALNITIPVALHLDHGTYEGAFKAIEAGFSSVMFDGSKYKFEENLKLLDDVLNKAHAKNISVEAEVGSIGGSEDGTVSNGELANVEECRKMSTTGISCLAAGIGNIHGIYPSNWKGINFDRLTEIANVTNHIPLVLHGGSGIPENMIEEAIKKGVAKINVNTECQLAFASATRKYIENKEDLNLDKKGFDPRKLLKPGEQAIIDTITQKMKLFGCINKAN